MKTFFRPSDKSRGDTVDAVYTRANDLREKVDAVLLKKIDWKILFSVNGQRTVTDIAAKVERDEDYVDEVLSSLAEKNLIELLSGADEPKKKEKPVKKTEKKTAVRKPKADETTETVKPAVTAEKKKEEPKPEPVPEEVLEPIIEEKAPVFTEPKKEEALDFSIEPEPVVKPAEEIKPPAAEKSAETTGAKKILVIDDSVVIQKMVEIALENHPYQLTSAMKGEDAIKLVKETKPQLVLLDIMLPDMSGLDVMKAIKAMGAAFQSIPIIILSGKDSPQDKDTALGNGANDFLTKPFHDEDLIAKVKEYIK